MPIVISAPKAFDKNVTSILAFQKIVSKIIKETTLTLLHEEKSEADM